MNREAGNTIYIRIYENRVNLRNIDDRKGIELTSDDPFTTERLLVANFTVAQTLLKKGLKIVMGKKFFPPAVIIHPMEKVDGGLSQVEDRVLKDLAIVSGAGKIVLWTGDELTDADALEKARESQ